MNEIGMPKQWTEEQWGRVQQVVHDQALKTRVAARFLPLVGPLPPGTATVPAERVIGDKDEIGEHQAHKKDLVQLKQSLALLEVRKAEQMANLNAAISARPQVQTDIDNIKNDLTSTEWSKIECEEEIAKWGLAEIREGREHGGLGIKEGEVLRLLTVALPIKLTSTQQSEPDLVSALTLFARAANVVARTEDAIIFTGEDPHILKICKVSPDPLKTNCLLNASNQTVPPVPHSSPPHHISPPYHTSPPCFPPLGDDLVTAVAEGIALLDSQGFLAPYALVLAENLFVVAETPSGSGLVLPSDRIRPLIEGPFLRSGALPCNQGVLVSLPSNPVEIVVASDIHVRFLQLNDHGEYIYRVSQRFVLRIKERDAIVRLQFPG